MLTELQEIENSLTKIEYSYRKSVSEKGTLLELQALLDVQAALWAIRQAIKTCEKGKI